MSPLHLHSHSLGIIVGVLEAGLTVGVGCWSVNFGVLGDELQDQQQTEEAACSTDAGGDFLPGEEEKSRKILL